MRGLVNVWALVTCANMSVHATTPSVRIDNIPVHVTICYNLVVDKFVNERKMVFKESGKTLCKTRLR